MANVNVIDGASASKYLKASGAGSAGDPYIPEHLETNSAAITTSVQLIDDAIATIAAAIVSKAMAIAGTDGTNARIVKTDSSGELQVDVLTLPALVAGTAAIGKLAANSGVDIGDVDVTSIAAGETHLGEVGGNLVSVSTEFTRPADTTAYAANDVVSDSTSSTTMQALANAARVSGGSGYIVGIKVSTDKKSITPRIRVHFFGTNGATIAADNVAYKEVYSDGSKRLFYYDMPAMTTAADTTNSDMSRSVDTSMRIPYICNATSLYYVLETLDAFTPATGQKITVTAFLDRN